MTTIKCVIKPTEGNIVPLQFHYLDATQKKWEDAGTIRMPNFVAGLWLGTQVILAAKDNKALNLIIDDSEYAAALNEGA